MSQMQEIIDTEIINIENALPDIRNAIQRWQGLTKFLWAEDYVYGIDLDNRLVKTTKVSAFFNGDGEANVIWANGLDNFEKTEEYRDLLRQTQPYDRKNNSQFDILISNPPYSVEAFKSMLKHGEETFELYNHVTDNSSEIECLFVERMKQLLKIGGWASVILPSSILSNSGIHSKAREIIFKYFNVKAVVELGSGTFMKTGTNTVVFFLERRSDNDFVAIEKAIDTFISNQKDVTVLGIENAFSKYVANVYDDLAFEDYISFICGKPNTEMQKHELYLDYIKVFDDKVYSKAIGLEREKIFYFLLTHSQNIVLVKTGQKQDEKAFLGYEFSERRGHEGIKHLPSGTKLFDEDGDLMNPQKANSYIYNAFLGKEVSVDEDLAQNVSYGRMSGFINYGTSKFDKTINFNQRERRLAVQSKWDMVEISKLCVSGRGRVMDKHYINSHSGEYPVYSSQTENDGVFGSINSYDFDGEYVTWTTDGAKAGTVFYRNGKFNCTNVCGTLKAKTDVNMKYLALVLSNIAPLYVTKKGNDKLMNNAMNAIKIPLPPLDVQKKIVAEIERIEKEEIKAEKRIGELKSNFKKSEYFSCVESRIKDLTVLVKRGKTAKYGNSSIQIIKSGQARGYCEFDFSQRHYVTDNFVSDERNLRKGDLLINSTGVGTAGRVTFFDLDGDFVVDSHITIVRFNTTKTVPKYAMYALANIGFKTIENMANGQSGQIELPLETINNISIPLPPLAKQKQIVAKIEKFEAEIKEQQTKLAELKAAKDDVLKKYL
jgi:type I restriction enzyme M protein